MEFPALKRADGKNVSDEELLRRIKRDDAGALKALFHRYYPALCRFSASIVKSDECAEEAVSDVFAALWLKRRSIGIRSSIKPYLYGAVRNQSLNVLRSSGLRTESIGDDDAELTSPMFDADRALQYNELQSSIDDLLSRLPERRRLIFCMSRLDGLSYQEIADILSISIHTVQNQMVEAVKFLACARLSGL
jgi:RNA polymerase sigma-70 factor, ECF subfamily